MPEVIFFRVNRRERPPYGDRHATRDDIHQMEMRIMTALEDAVASLQQALSDANQRLSTDALQQALTEERARYDALVASEDAEDVQQNQELADARAATDAALAQVNDATQALQSATDQVNQLGQAATADAGGTDTPAPTDQPAPPAPADAAPTPPADTTPPAAAPATDQPTAPDGTTTTPAPTGDEPPAAPAEGPTPTDTGAAPDQVADQPATGSVVDNTPEGGDPTDVTNMRPAL
jgi:hypothetical protein